MRGCVALLVLACSGCSWIVPHASSPHPNDSCLYAPALLDTAVAVSPLVIGGVMVSNGDRLHADPIGGAFVVISAGVGAVVFAASAITGYSKWGRCQGARAAAAWSEAPAKGLDSSAPSKAMACSAIITELARFETSDPARWNEWFLDEHVRACHDAEVARAEDAAKRRDACRVARTDAYARLAAVPRDERAAAARALPSCSNPADEVDAVWTATRDAIVAALEGQCRPALAHMTRLRELDPTHHARVLSMHAEITACINAEREACRSERARLQLEALHIVDFDARMRALQSLPTCDLP